MPYEIFIIPSELHSSEENWINAVCETEGVRIADGPLEKALNQKTGKPKHIEYSPDAEIYFPSEEQWECALRWRDGRIAINARFDIGNPQDPTWNVVSKLDERLDAKIQGEELEEYDIYSGKILKNPEKITSESTNSINDRNILKGDSFYLAFPYNSYSTFEVWPYVLNWLTAQSILERTYMVGRRKSKAEKVFDRLLDKDGRHSEVTGVNIEFDYICGNRRTFVSVTPGTP